VRREAEAKVQLRLSSGAREAKGVVYTKPWVVDLILDLVGYRSDADLATMVAVEPAAGEGAFLVPMVRRLLTSLQLHERTVEDAKRALLAYELDSEASTWARELVVKELTDADIPRREAERTAAGWIVEGDYLLSSTSAPRADVVVGNPPYIRYDDLPEDLLRSYKAVCRTMIGRCDVYVGFIEAGVRQLKAGGRLGFICADRWMRSAYGAELRRFIADNASVEAVIEMHDAPAFDEEVSAYPAVTVIRRGEQGPALVASAGPDSGSAAGDGDLAAAIVELADKRRGMLPGIRAAKLPGWYPGNSPWPWAEPEHLALIRRLEADCRPLEDIQTGTKVGIGVATGADKVFITTDTTVAESDRLLPLAMAQDTRMGTVKWSGHYLIDPWGPDDHLVDLSGYPKLAAYYAAHSSILGRRNIAGRDPARWYRTIDRVNHSLLKRDKLYFPDMKLQANPVLDRGETYPHHNLYFIISDTWDLEVLGGLLLSRIAEMFVASYCVKMRGGTLRFQAQYLRRIRVPEWGSLDEELRTRLRDAFRRRDREAATAAASEGYGIGMATAAN
jgi:adenine-specific DNA-methyltransferase